MHIYKFECPVPCNKMIKVSAQNQDDAITKIITAGALNCRKIADQYCHENVHNIVYPLPEKQIHEIVMLSMELEG
jgi:hypothetical protein